MKLPSLPPRRTSVAIRTAMLTVALTLLLCGCGRRSARNQPLGSLSEQDQTMLKRYETLRVALAQDDFRGAKRQAMDFAKDFESANPSRPKPPSLDYLINIANAVGIDAQREAFRGWSKLAIERTSGIEGFYVIHCPLPGCGDWVQRDANVDNPFMGKAMHDCGEVQK